MNADAMNDPEFQLYLFGPLGSVEPRFDDDVMAGLSGSFNIPASKIVEVKVILEMACRAYWTQTLRPELRSKEVRDELATLSKAANDLSERIAQLSPKTREMLLEAGRRQRLDTPSTPRLSEEKEQNPTAPRISLHLHRQSGEGGAVLDFAEWVDGIDALRICADGAAVLAGAGKPGPAPDHAAFFLINVTFGAWTKTLRREFSVDWADNGDWLTEASRFCMEVALTVDPDIKRSRIRTAARLAQKESKEE